MGRVMEPHTAWIPPRAAKHQSLAQWCPSSRQPGLHPLPLRRNSSFTRAIIYFFHGHIFQTLLTQSVLSIHLLRGLSSVPFPEAPSYNFFTLRSLFKRLPCPPPSPNALHPSPKRFVHRIPYNQEHLHICLTFMIRYNH